MSNTEKNIHEAFAGESMARNKYTYFAKVAKEEGFIYVSKVFEETADNEMQHAKEHFKLLKGIGDTKTNLKAAIEGENYETNTMYPDFAKAAKAEGDKIAENKFMQIGKVEAEHEMRYRKLLQMLENGTLYKRESPIRWKCSKCGYMHTGKEPPGKCPACGHPTTYFEPECLCFSDECEMCKVPSKPKSKS